jgi:hypothetical protein
MKAASPAVTRSISASLIAVHPLIYHMLARRVCRLAPSWLIGVAQRARAWPSAYYHPCRYKCLVQRRVYSMRVRGLRHASDQIRSAHCFRGRAFRKRRCCVRWQETNPDWGQQTDSEHLMQTGLHVRIRPMQKKVIGNDKENVCCTANQNRAIKFCLKALFKCEYPCPSGDPYKNIPIPKTE